MKVSGMSTNEMFLFLGFAGLQQAYAKGDVPKNMDDDNDFTRTVTITDEYLIIEIVTPLTAYEARYEWVGFREQYELEEIYFF